MRIVDLTLKVNDNMSMFPDPKYFKPDIRFVMSPEEDPIYTRYSTAFSICVHTGTHLDTPMHMNIEPYVKSIDKVPYETLIGDAVVVKLLDVTTGPVTADMIKAHLPSGISTRGKRLLVLSGINDTELWGSDDYFDKAPYFTADAADWMLESEFVLVGSDVMTDKFKGDGIVHQKLLGNGVYILEYLCNVEALKADEVFLIVAPTPLEGCESAPTRVFAIEDFVYPQ